MRIIQVGPGEQHSFAISALRIRLTGNGGAVLTALDQSGAESVDIRLQDTEIVLTPRSRRVTLAARSADGGSFPASSSVGLTVYTEGRSDLQEQVIVEPQDVGALRLAELGVIEFAPSRAVLTATTGSPGSEPDSPTVPTFVSSQLHEAPGPAPSARRTDHPSRAATGSTAPAPLSARPGDHQWMRAGRYALRDAGQLGSVAAPRTQDWALVLDGSISMRRLAATGVLENLMGLVCGIWVTWTDSWPRRFLMTGAVPRDLTSVVSDPAAVPDVLLSAPPWSGSLVAPIVHRLLTGSTPGAAVVLVTDGVPGDVEELVVMMGQVGERSLHIVTTGVSALGLPGDEMSRQPWHEELGGLSGLASLSNVTVSAVQVSGGSRLTLEDGRAAELAQRLTSRGGVPV